jgi:transposase
MSKRYPRRKHVGTLAAVRDRLAQGQSQRRVAEELGVARSTVQAWLGQAPTEEVPAAPQQFHACW